MALDSEAGAADTNRQPVRTVSGDPQSVSVVIPTLNAAATLEACLRSILGQTHSDVEVIVVDAESSDGTSSIASRWARVIRQDSSMTEARLIGARRASGRHLLNLDADQVLEPDTIQRALATGAEVVAFGEISEGRGLVARINRMDLGRTQSNWQDNMDPVRGQIRPRFYARELLIEALESIPPAVLRLRPSPFSEDSLIFLNALRRKPRCAFVPAGIRHEEVLGPLTYMRKWHHYGLGARAYRGTPYEVLVHQRGFRSGGWSDRLASLPALALRGVPFAIGYHT